MNRPGGRVFHHAFGRREVAGVDARCRLDRLACGQAKSGDAVAFAELAESDTGARTAQRLECPYEKHQSFLRGNRRPCPVGNISIMQTEQVQKWLERCRERLDLPWTWSQIVDVLIALDAQWSAQRFEQQPVGCVPP